LNALKISIHITVTNPTIILIPICEVDTVPNIKKVEKTGTINSKPVIKTVIPIMIKTKLFLYRKVVNIE
jgi:hypothetical protein